MACLADFRPAKGEGEEMAGCGTKVKICGLQDVEVLKSMVDLEIDYIGLVFAPSRRRVTAGQAAELAAELKNWRNGEPPLAAGVFVNPGPEELDRILAEVPLAVVQLHGEESPEYCRETRRRHPGIQVWKALSIGGEEEARNAGSAPGHGPEDLDPYAGAVDAVLLDTFDPARRGGSGKTFAWERIPAYRQRAEELGLPLFVAGGLHPGNIRELIGTYMPYGVDVSSGVETEGAKDIAKMKAFVERVKG